MKGDSHTFSGTLTAIATPFTSDGSRVDEGSLKRLIDFQFQNGVQGVVVCGSTGEAATLTDEEYRQTVKWAYEFTNRRGICIAGIGGSDTTRARKTTEFLEQTGVDGILLVAPPYNKPPQRGIVGHFREVKRATNIPIIAYNIPGRSSVNILPTTLNEMADEGLIVGVKEASGNMDQVLDLLALVRNKISVLSGEDSLVSSLMAAGGTGVITAVGNVIPELFVEITSNALSGKWDAAREAQFKALPIIRTMFAETNPIPVKTALFLKGIISTPALRLPLVPAEQATIERIKKVLSL